MSHFFFFFFCSLGITQHLIKGGVARLEEVRGADGVLEDVFIRVRGK
jgi:dipeptidyl-peptidase III